MRRLASSALYCAVSASLFAGFIACAEGSSADPGEGAIDAGEVEASGSGKPKDGATTDDGEDPTDEDSGSTKDSGPTSSSACLAALDKAKFDFEASVQGWTHQASDLATGSWPFDPWSWGTATTISCPSGKCWGAERTQKYAQCQRGELVSPKIDLSACAGETVSLVFTHAYAFWSNATWFDGGIVEISMDDGSSWQQPGWTLPNTVKINPSMPGGYDCLKKDQFYVHNKKGFTGTQTTATTIELAVPGNYLNDKIRVRFMQASGVSSQTLDANTSRNATAAGWRIDDVHFAVK